jgi:hypothetical protein
MNVSGPFLESKFLNKWIIIHQISNYKEKYFRLKQKSGREDFLLHIARINGQSNSHATRQLF